MDMSLSPRCGKLVYGLIFTLLLPLALWGWTSRLACPLPAVHSASLGTVILAVGILLMCSGMWRLFREGGGLPMNAFPPPRVARGGAYALVPHPIYTGFVAACAGISLVSNSSAGLWIATPLSALACLALVIGYEAPDLHSRFGSTLPEPWLGISSGQGPLTLGRRWGTALAILILWSVAYIAIKTLGVPRDAVETRLGWEWGIPVWPAMMPLYASIYLAVPLAFLLCPHRAAMRRLASGALMAIGLNTLLYLVVPATAAFRTVPANDWMSEWLAWEQRLAMPAAASWPSFHMTWGVLCAVALTHGSPRWTKILAWLWLLGLGFSCLATGMHSASDVLAGTLMGGLCAWPGASWQQLLDWTERLGNAWKAWKIGPLRVMSHCLWAGLAGFAGLLLVGATVTTTDLGWISLVAAGALAGAALWAQWVEGSSALLRPFGYYGSILGGLIALALVFAAGGSALSIMAAFAIAAPWIQAIGRFRCIVQGCCHGRPADWGIRITNSHSRVVKLAGLAGVAIHPTPLYSILANIVIGLFLLRLRIGGAGPFVLGGLYLVLAGLSRFAEEAYRGEPQTRRFAGLALYQWMAVGSLLLGMILMAMPDAPLPALHPPTSWMWAGAFAWGLICAFAMGMDFPNSNRRFSRLTG